MSLFKPKNALVYFFILITSTVHGQNLVRNASFEEITRCPDKQSDIDATRYWEALMNTPDLFHTCCQDPVVPLRFSSAVPDNTFGYQLPASGNAYAGIAAHYQPSKEREYVGIKLTQPLKKGCYYSIGFKTNLANSNFNTTYACNNLGMLFTFGGIHKIPNYAHLNHPDIIEDTVGWTVISGYFKADTNYTHLALGNFFDNKHTKVKQLLNRMYVAYYYIDDVWVEEIPFIEVQDTIICKGDSIVLNAVSCQDYYWSLSYDGRDTFSLSSKLILYPEEDFNIYLFSGKRKYSRNIKVYPPPVAILGNDTSVCPDILVPLDAYHQYASYLWSTGDSSSGINVSLPGVYWVKVKRGSCIDVDTIEISHKENSFCVQQIHLFPNPFFENITIKGYFPVPVDINLNVYDALGKHITNDHIPQVKYEFVNILKLYWLQPGMYFLRIHAGEKVYVFKIVKLM